MLKVSKQWTCCVSETPAGGTHPVALTFVLLLHLLVSSPLTQVGQDLRQL